MNDKSKTVGIIFNTIITGALTTGLYFLYWTANTVVSQGKTISEHTVKINYSASRLDTLEKEGSKGLQAHEKSDDERVGSIKDNQKQMQATLQTLAGVPEALRGVGLRLDMLKESIDRVEKNQQESWNRNGKP